jgi:hypothetical protein
LQYQRIGLSLSECGSERMHVISHVFDAQVCGDRSKIAGTQCPAIDTFRLNEHHAECRPAAIELMAGVRMHDSGPRSPPVLTLFRSYQELAIKSQRHLNGVVSMDLRTANVAPDPNAAAVPEQHATDCTDAPIVWARWR